MSVEVESALEEQLPSFEESITTTITSMKRRSIKLPIEEAKQQFLQLFPELERVDGSALDSTEEVEKLATLLEAVDPDCPEVIDEFMLEKASSIRKQRKLLRLTLLRTADHLEKYSKLVEKYGDQVTEQMRKKTIAELEDDVRMLWIIFMNCGLFVGMMLLLLGIPGLCVLILVLIISIVGSCTVTYQVQIIDKLSPMLQKMIRRSSSRTSISLKSTAKAIKNKF
jgi:DNA-binding ferritin-like protein